MGRFRCCRGLDHEVVHRVIGSLLERDAHDAAAVAKFRRAVAGEQRAEVHHRDLALEGDATAAGRVRAHPAALLQPGAHDRIVRGEVPPIRACPRGSIRRIRTRGAC